MPLQQLVNHFNDRFEQEHHANFRPFIVENGAVQGWFGPIRMGSRFSPVRMLTDYEAITGHLVQLAVAPHTGSLPYDTGFEFTHFLTDSISQPTDFQSVINLDRLCRTVHMLNYLGYAHVNGRLFLDVDPRHILGVDSNHGVYFEEIIVKCGLATSNVVISMAVNPFYILHHNQLLAGLNNYRKRGYQIALNIGRWYSANGLVDFVTKLAPNFVRIDVPEHNPHALKAETPWPYALDSLQQLVTLIGGQSILQQVNYQDQAFTASAAGFDWVQGGYYDKLAVDHLRCL